MRGVKLSEVKAGKVASNRSQTVTVETLGGDVKIRKLSKAKVTAFQAKREAASEGESVDHEVGDEMLAASVEFETDDGGWELVGEVDAISNLPVDAYTELTEKVLEINGLTEAAAKESRQNFSAGDDSVEGSDAGSG